MTNKENPTKVSEASSVPSEEALLKQLKQDKKRKEYQQTPKAIANRKKYQDKKKAEQKAMREYLAANPDVKKALEAKLEAGN